MPGRQRRWCRRLGSGDTPMADTPSRARRLRGEYFTPAAPGGGGARRWPCPMPGGARSPWWTPAAAMARSSPPRRRRCPAPGSTGWSSTPATQRPRPWHGSRGRRVLGADALRGGWDALLARLPADGTELWLGNPPYNGTSPLLRDGPAYRALRARLGLDPILPPGTSLRDDYAFFLLLAAERLVTRRGVLAWVTSATLLDSYVHAPLRRRLLDVLALEEVVDLDAGAFPGTRVRTCITVWRSHRGPVQSARFRGWSPEAAATVPASSRPLPPRGPGVVPAPRPGERRCASNALWRAQRRAARHPRPGQLHRAEDALRRAAGGRRPGAAPRAGRGVPPREGPPAASPGATASPATCSTSCGR